MWLYAVAFSIASSVVKLTQAETIFHIHALTRLCYSHTQVNAVASNECNDAVERNPQDIFFFLITSLFSH